MLGTYQPGEFIFQCFCLFILFMGFSRQEYWSGLPFPSPVDHILPSSYAILLFIALDFTSITGHIHSWVLSLLWLHLFILSGVIFPLFSSSILGIYRASEFIFQCPIFLPFHSVHGVLKARLLKWLAISFSSGPRFVRTVHYDPSILGGPTWHGSQLY